tara:strand:+ start:13308 stop:14711 length:1404 start_codon:yes stop_codon:yes gene_type:complete
MSSVVTRFAPSPTGFLHIGGVRTALFNYLFTQNSKKKGNDSKFLLRIEDTDQKRYSLEYEESIINGLKWLGINWDGKIFKQSNNIDLHIKIANELLEKGNAFKCVCTKDQLEKVRKENLKKGLSIKRLCTKCEDDKVIQSATSDFCIRIKIPKKGLTEINDLVQGNVKVLNSEIDNYVLIRSDKTPTYMLSVVVDDINMGITNIIRGDDHLNNAFRQYHLYKNIGCEIPEFTHIPLIFGIDGKKLSKRHGATDINEFKYSGYLDTSILNYLMQLGININNNKYLNIQEAINEFKINSILKAPSRFDYKKLNSINSHYLSELKNDSIINYLKKNYNFSIVKNDNMMIEKILNVYKKRCSTLFEIYDQMNIYTNLNYMKKIKINISLNSKDLVKKLYNIIKNEENWSKDDIEIIMKDFIKNNKIKYFEIGKPLRLILTGKEDAPSIADIFDIMGKDNTLKRINNFLIQF